MISANITKRQPLRILFISTILFLSSVNIVNAQPQKSFINTFLIRIGGNNLSAGDENTIAKYDMVMLNRFHYNDIQGNTWAALRAINPDIEIYPYELSFQTRDDHDNSSPEFLNHISRYNDARGHSMGNLNTDNPEFFLLDSSSNRIWDTIFAVPHLFAMDFGNSDYQAYWVEAVKNDIIDQPWAADGIWIDLSVSFLPTNQLSSIPVKYPTNTQWIPAMIEFVNGVSAGLHAHNTKAWVNRGESRHSSGYDAWIALDNTNNPPDAALEEGAFALKWGNADVQFLPEDQWKRQVDVLKNVKNYRVTTSSHSDVVRGGSGIDNWGDSFTFWDVVWYSITSFLLGKQDNSYFFFSEGYSNATWLDELDSNYLDLGNAVGEYTMLDIGGIKIYRREFTRGFVYVNPTNKNVSGIVLPEITKQLNHANFKDDPITIPDISTLDLPPHRGTILLKQSSLAPQAPKNLRLID